MFDSNKYTTIPAHVRAALDVAEDAAVAAGETARHTGKLREARLEADRVIGQYLADVARAGYADGLDECKATK